MKFFKKNLGITLIALVVTIIVLLILAGVSISMLTGQNGILNRASEAKEKTEQAQQDESDKMIEMEAMLQTAGTKVTNPSSYGTNPNAQATADGAGKYFALPDGAKYITGTVDTGVVVEIKESYFVWVPVDDVVLDKERINELPTSSENGTLSGKTYTPMAVKIGNNYKGILYEYGENNSYLKYADNENYQGNSTENREPDVVTRYDATDSDTVEGKITIDRLTSEYNEMIESVKKYKGFYIAQYEAGIDTSTTDKAIVFKDASKDSNITTAYASASDLGTSSWYGLYKKIKTFATVENSEDKVVSSMIWGSQYDAMLNWMEKNGKNVDENLIRNRERITGKNKNDIINNIYDLYGCHFEWTLEASGNGVRICRGGDTGSSDSLAKRNSDYPNNERFYISSRATLHIK